MVLDDDQYFDNFVRFGSGIPSIGVDTTNGYEPELEGVVDFINGRASRRATP
jgi:hypothetical protein